MGASNSNCERNFAQQTLDGCLPSSTVKINGFNFDAESVVHPTIARVTAEICHRAWQGVSCRLSRLVQECLIRRSQGAEPPSAF
ncbi:hypothetical protein BJ508DRAFT_419337 [Ascobolus immersus RN42]|uniref:Uncharacterized protein n=1 Tax=Ascobolus immersus RN42 TaxID=1160509 RepID=A0A3N4HEU7_ASCIM|nr:hypothetical protein BJ508DRAFT_419337 [Ascobolus immersus RN42]